MPRVSGLVRCRNPFRRDASVLGCDVETRFDAMPLCLDVM